MQHPLRFALLEQQKFGCSDAALSRICVFTVDGMNARVYYTLFNVHNIIVKLFYRAGPDLKFVANATNTHLPEWRIGTFFAWPTRLCRVRWNQRRRTSNTLTHGQHKWQTNWKLPNHPPKINGRKTAFQKKEKLSFY